jgi:hypothetical protein
MEIMMGVFFTFFAFKVISSRLIKYSINTCINKSELNQMSILLNQMWEYIHYSINLYTYTNIKHPKHIEVQRACINHLCLFLICQFKCKWTKYALQIKGFPCTLKKQHFNLKKISWIRFIYTCVRWFIKYQNVYKEPDVKWK